MSIWKDLLLLGGYVATPSALRALEGQTRVSQAARPRPDTSCPDKPEARRLPWAGLKADHLVLR